MINDKTITDKNLVPHLMKCINCHGYGTLGFKRVTCPTCKGTGVIQLPIESGVQND